MLIDFFAGIFVGIIFSLVLLLVAALYTMLFPSSAQEQPTPILDEPVAVPQAFYDAFENDQ